MSEQRKGKKRPKSYYRKCAAGGKRARKTQNVSAGMRGFLVTCNKYEKETVREMYNLLNEYADVMYGSEMDRTKPKISDESESDSDEEDMEKAMAKETSAIKQANSAERRFQNTDTRCKNVIFIRTTVEDPCRLAHEIFRDIQEKQVQKVRYAIRMLPVAAVCAPVPKDIEKTLRDVLGPHFETEIGVGIKYTAVCKIRNNNSVSKNTILPLLGKIIKEMNPQHQLCHDEPELVIIVEVVQKACCFGVVKDYFRFKKYNLHEIINKCTEEETFDTGIDKTGEEIVDNDIEAGNDKTGEEIVDNDNETCEEIVDKETRNDKNDEEIVDKKTRNDKNDEEIVDKETRNDKNDEEIVDKETRNDKNDEEIVDKETRNDKNDEEIVGNLDTKDGEGIEGTEKTNETKTSEDSEKTAD